MWSRYCAFPLVVKWSYNSENAFPKDFLTKLDTYQDYSITLESAKEKLKNDIRFGKWGQIIIFHVLSFWPNNDHSDFCVFSLFWCTKKNYRWLFCDKNRQNDHIQNQTWDVLFISVFLQHFSHSMFSPFICIRWRTNGVWVKLHIIK